MNDPFCLAGDSTLSGATERPANRMIARMLFEVSSRRFERSSTMVTSNLPFAEGTEVLWSEWLTGAL